MKNLMAKAMSERYEEYLHTSGLEERAAKNIYYWVMSTLECLFWGNRRTAYIELDLYANKNKMYIVFCDPTGEEHEFVYYSTHECGNGKLPVMLQKFVEIFNNIDYPLAKKISSPSFHAFCFEKLKAEGKYKGYYQVRIQVDMLPDADDDPANHGIA